MHMKTNPNEADIKRTLGSIQKLSKGIYFMDYSVDYDLDHMLKMGFKSSIKMYKEIRNITKVKTKYKKLKASLGCSTFECKDNDGNHLLGRNFDYRTSPCLVIKTHPSYGYISIGITDLNFMFRGYKRKIENKKNNNALLNAPYLVMDGINEKGLAIAVLELKDKPVKQKNNKTPITTCVAIRAILDKCATVQEALHLLDRYDMFSSLGYNYHFQIIDQKESVVVEFVKNKMIIVDKDANNNQIATNFYLSQEGNSKKCNGFDRYNVLYEFLKEKKGILNKEECFDALHKVKQHYKFVYKGILRYYVDTCWSALYNTSKLQVTVENNGDMHEFRL